MDLEQQIKRLADDDARPTEAGEARSRARFADRLAAASQHGVRTPRRPRPRWLVPAVGLAALAFVGGAVTTALLASDDDKSSPPIAISEALKEYPEGTAQDVVTWANAVVVAKVASSAPAPDAAEDAAQDNLVNRDIRFTVDSVVWRQPSTNQAVPTELNLEFPGWVVTEGGERVPYATEGDVQFEDGQTYLIPLVFDGDQTPTVLSGASFEIVDGTISPSEAQSSGLAAALRGGTVSDAQDLFDSTPPDPEVKPFMKLSPHERVRALQRQESK